MELELFIIGYGLSGGFGGIRDYEVIRTIDLEDANKWAYDQACDIYESYSGMHGLSSMSEIMEENDCDEEEAQEIYNDERDSWIESLAVPYSKEEENRVSGNHWSNPYSEITDKL